jgi:hypothetical protein
MVSAFALIVRRPIDGSFAQNAERNQTPSHQDDLTLAGVTVQADDGLKKSEALRFKSARSRAGRGHERRSTRLFSVCQNDVHIGHT